jgi:hypothetical protein
LSVELIEKAFAVQAETLIRFPSIWRMVFFDMFLGKREAVITVTKMSFLDKAKKKAEEEAKRAADAAKNAGEKGAHGVRTAGGKVKEAGEKGADETKKALKKAKEKID